MEHFGNRLIGQPRRCIQQHMGTGDSACGRFAFVDHVEQVAPLFFGEINQLLVGHGVSSC